MLPAPIEHRFAIDGEAYRLVEWDRGGERRLRAAYALALGPAATVLEVIDGASLYAEAIAQECLVEAPDIFWTTRVGTASQNGTPTRVVNVDKVPRALWERFRVEVDAFLAKLFPAVPADVGAPDAAGPGDATPVALAQALSPVLRGRAE